VRIRIYRAFSSNNSGSYTLVGRFRDDASAGEVAAVLAELCAAHSAWYEASTSDGLEESPLLAFARTNGLVNLPADASDHWPEHGPPPRIVHVGPQLLVLVPYTVTMPPAIGEYIYRRGGRVELELDHSHTPLAVEFFFWIRGAAYNDPTTPDRIAALRTLIDAELAALIARPPHDRRPVTPPAWYRGDWGATHLAVVFADVGAGILRIRELARAAGIDTHVRIFEILDRDPDPFAALRAERPHTAGRHRVVVWSAGASRIVVMKVVRELVGCGLAEARASLDALPNEILRDVSQAVAEDAAHKLREAGADAEAFVPRPSEPEGA